MAFFSFPNFSYVTKGRNFIILLLVVAAFIMLNRYRQNDPIPVTSAAPDFMLSTADNQLFRLYDIHTPVVLVFYNTFHLGGNNVLSKAYERELPNLKLIQNQGRVQIIILIKGVDTPEKLGKFYDKKNMGYLENISFAYLDPDVDRKYGIRSWPHMFILDSNHNVRFQTKILTSETVKKQLKGI